MGRSYKSLFLGGVAVAVVLTVLSLAITTAAIKRLNANTALVTHTDAVLHRIGNVLSLLQDAETGQRGFLLTDKPGYLEPFEAATKALPTEMQGLADLVADNPEQTARLADVRRGAGAKLTELYRTIEAQKAESFDAARAIVMSDEGKAQMDSLRKALAQMRDEELRLRDFREKEARRTYRQGLQLGIAMGTLALLAILSFAVAWHRYLTRGSQAEMALAAASERFRITLASIGDAVITTDTAGVVTYMNPTAGKLTAWQEERAIGKPLAKIFPIVNETSRKTVESPVEKALREGRVVGLANHTVLVRPDGTEIAIDDSAAPIQGADGQIEGCVLVFRDVSERRATEERAQKSDSQLRVTLASIGDAVIAADATGNVSYLNEVAAQITGWTAEDAAGRPLEEVFYIRHEVTGEKAENPAVRAMQEGHAVALANHTILVSKQGLRIPIDDSAAPIRDGSGAISGAVLIFRDVTKRREHDRELERSEEQFRSLADSIPQLCWMAQPDGHIFWYNRGWYAYTGTTFQDMQGWGWQSVHDPAVLPSVMERWQHSISRGEPFEMVFPLKKADGHFRQFLTRVLPVKDEQGKVTRWFGTNTDITVVKEAEAALARREQQLQTLADNTPDVLARFDRELRHVFVNAAVERATGRAPEQFIGKTNRELGMPVELCDVWDPAIAAVFERQHTTTREFSYESPTGARHFSVTFIPERDAAGEVIHVLGVSHDRTAEKEAQDALRVADRRKDEFLATLAHELRNPLAPVRTGLQVLRLTRDPEMSHRTQLMMERQLGQMVRLIDDLLEVSRITSGKVVLRLERIELQHAVHTAVEAARPQIDAAAQQLHLDMPDEPIWLQADTTRICQVVSNLLANAGKYSPDGSAISLTVRRQGPEVVITVSDQGEGIPQNMLSHVFEMFAQVDRTLDRAQGGLGIGLALVKRLVEMHSGTVSVESPGLGAGSTFTVHLPTAAPEERFENPIASASDMLSETTLRVLVVDDNVDAAETLGELLIIYGHEARVAHSGEAGLALAREFQPSLVFLDIGMPGMNGYETARRIRQDASLLPMTLVALTGWGAEADKTKAKDAGFDLHFTKPVELDNVENILQFVAARQKA